MSMCYTLVITPPKFKQLTGKRVVLSGVSSVSNNVCGQSCGLTNNNFGAKVLFSKTKLLIINCMSSIFISIPIRGCLTFFTAVAVYLRCPVNLALRMSRSVNNASLSVCPASALCLIYQSKSSKLTDFHHTLPSLVNQLRPLAVLSAYWHRHFIF